MKPGPKPKPTPLKILEGCRSSRINRQVPKPILGSAEPPGYLEGHALEFWHEVAPMLTSTGILALTDRHMFAMLCEAYQMMRSSPADIRYRDLFRKLAAEFGLTPSSRSSLKAPEKPKDALGDFLKR